MYETADQLLRAAEIAAIHQQLSEIDSTNDPKIKQLHQQLAQVGMEQKREDIAE